MSNVESVNRMFRVDKPRLNIPVRYNITPTSQIVAVRETENGRELASLRWDFVASWLKDIQKRRPIVNARSEGIENAPMFRASIRRRRCLIPADGFYEWQDVDGVKMPWCIRMKDESLFAFGGIWEHWTGATGDEIQSAAVITCDPNSLMAPIHSRMPVIISPTEYDTWLDPKTSLPEALSMLKPYDENMMTAYRVGKAIGNVKADGPELMEPISL